MLYMLKVDGCVMRFGCHSFFLRGSKVGDSKFRCLVCRKLFRAPEFVHKHLRERQGLRERTWLGMVHGWLGWLNLHVFFLGGEGYRISHRRIYVSILQMGCFLSIITWFEKLREFEVWVDCLCVVLYALPNSRAYGWSTILSSFCCEFLLVQIHSTPQNPQTTSEKPW